MHVLGSYDLASINMTMTMILFQLKTKVIWFIGDFILLLREGETWENMHDHHLGISIQNYLWFSLETMMSFFEHICCLIALINHTILYIKSKCSIEYFLVFFKLTFKCYPCVSRLSTNSILNLWGAGQRLG